MRDGATRPSLPPAVTATYSSRPLYIGDDGGVCVFGTEVSQRLTHIEWHLGGDEACEEFSE